MIVQLYIELSSPKNTIVTAIDKMNTLRELLWSNGYSFYEAPDNDKLPKTLEEIESILEHK